MLYETSCQSDERRVLEDVTHEQSGVLWDVIALIEAARMNPCDNQGDSRNRLLRLENEKLQGVQHAFGSYI